MISWLQLEKRLAPLPLQIISRMHLACLKPAQVCSEASRDWVWDWPRPSGGGVCVDGSLFGRAGVGQCYYQVTKILWSPRENHEAGASEDCSE